MHYRTDRYLLANGASYTYDLPNSIDLIDDAATLYGSMLVPRLSAVVNPTINGVTFEQSVTSAGTTPTIAWSPPTVGTPSAYIVRIARLVSQNGYTAVGQMLTFITGLTSLTVPPGLLVQGQVYSVGVTAVSTSVDLTRAPYRTPLPAAYATYTSLYLIP